MLLEYALKRCCQFVLMRKFLQFNQSKILPMLVLFSELSIQSVSAEMYRQEAVPSMYHTCKLHEDCDESKNVT
ncbi:hypothetical protein GUITHDRAFT_121325 [Guillardia theta CCMP2712]|uniref:Uncharacterized protein n=1 Tax=Guillardia theta (strain CCMP2712) TaxID=905079 RepID=L1I8A7_GUITC|nr:hypothetical protein GUITHDRAFT_121325 [Guillardia theta CCMP2712]EKX32506.1 hypothetical protein GUITHDRAFT_121325 [Guillardia theta CCMP2712]|eukprot:XP_005819486.1 hypothetical protein GUITHDRAFT_121325 [Guillardia theta CCMP2712]